MIIAMEKIEAINAELKAQGVKIVQEVDLGSRTIYGFKPQAIINAVNKIIGVENWRYEVVSMEFHPTTGKKGITGQAIARVEVYFRLDDNTWLCKGPQAGYMNVVYENLGDAQKGSITAAVQKGMSMWSIGASAYLGELEEVYRQAKSSTQKPASQKPAQKPATQPKTQPTTPTVIQPVTQSEQQPSDSLPVLGGVEFKTKNGEIHAVGQGVYGARTTLKSCGFKFRQASKLWWKPASAMVEGESSYAH